MKETRLSLSVFNKFPKVELHCHLDGSLRQSTLNELAQAEKITIPKALFGQVHASLEKYLEQFSTIGQVMQRAENIERIAFELVEDAALENTLHIEYRFCPILFTQEGLSIYDATLAAIRGGRQASEKYGVSFGVILCGIRSFSVDKNIEIAKTAVALKGSGVVGFDIAGPEFGFPAKDHLEAFSLAKDNFLFITIHAGEGYGADSIEQAIRYGGANRIGHGTRLIENRELLKHIVDERIPLEVCLTSNEQTGVVKSVSEHPLPLYLERGVIATLCTDNRLVSETTLSREYERAHLELGLTYESLKNLALNGVECAFLPEHKKVMLRSKMLCEFQKIEREFV